MARLAHAARTASALGALLVGMAAACAVDHAGLGSGAGGEAGVSAGGTSGTSGAAGTRASGGTAGGGTGGEGAGAGGVSAGGGGAAGTAVAGAGAAGTGVAGTGSAGNGGMAGGQTAGSSGTAGVGAGGGGTGGSAPGGSGGVAGGAGGGGAAGLGGIAGVGGAGGRGGSGGTGGRGGGGAPSCAKYPAGMAFTTPTDGKGHCYWLHSDRQTWPTARMRCQSDGGDLVTILSAAENQFVLSIGRFTNSPPELWLGGTDGKPGTDKSGPGTYRWVTNETWSYTNWNLTPPAQPDGFCNPCSAGQTCTCDHRTTMAMDGTWYDFWQDNPRGYVCEATP